MSHPATPAAPGPTLRRTLSLWQVSLSGVGVILGAGVYALVGPAAARAGSALWLSFVIAAVAAALTAYSYGRLAQRRPRNSPEFQYTMLAFGPRVGFVAGWLMLVADVLAAAAVALGFGGYLGHLAGTARRALGPGADTALALMALAATANTVLLLVLSASRSMYGMAAEGRLPRRLARIDRRSTPATATWAALGVTGLVVVSGDLVQAASMTDAAVLASFMLVNASLLWLARTGPPPATPRPLADVAIPGAALLMCGALLLHVGWLGMAAALAVAVVGLALGRRRSTA